MLRFTFEICRPSRNGIWVIRQYDDCFGSNVVGVHGRLWRFYLRFEVVI